jgi:hypothetical protein
MEVLTNVFTKKDLKSIQEKIRQPKWRYGHGSDNSNPLGVPFWIMEFNDDPFFSKYLLNIIRTKVNEPGLVLEHVYANGHVFGDKATPHVDSNSQDGRTFLFYANDVWDPLWGGSTVFNMGNGQYAYMKPEPNKAVYFPGMIQHHAEEVSRMYTGLRVTIAWKLNGAQH